jgi:hypothetical protein
MLKRAIPFILTFAVGLIVASFFVNIMPSLNFKRGEHRKCREHKEFRYENERFRTERNSENGVVPMRAEEYQNLENAVPPPPPMKRTK